MSHNGMASIKFTGSQARTIFQYKYTRTKVLKCCANIYFNKQCLIKKIVPGYANIKLPSTSPHPKKGTYHVYKGWNKVLI